MARFVAFVLGALLAASPVLGSGGLEAELEEIHRELQDVPYVYGGCDRRGMDCSCFVQHQVRELFGARIPRTTWDQVEALPIDRLSDVPTVASLNAETLCPGDLIYTYRGTSWRRGPRHVAFYAGDARILHAARGVGVAYQPLRVLAHHRLRGIARFGRCHGEDTDGQKPALRADRRIPPSPTPSPSRRPIVNPEAYVIKANRDYLAELEGGRLLLDLIAAEGDIHFAYAKDPQSILLVHYQRRFWFEKEPSLVTQIARSIVQSIKPESEFLHHPEGASGTTYKALIESLAEP